MHNIAKYIKHNVEEESGKLNHPRDILRVREIGEISKLTACMNE